jgi:hypothetical protein
MGNEAPLGESGENIEAPFTATLGQLTILATSPFRKEVVAV